MHEILSDLQGQCIPKIYGFFGSEHFKALVMAYMGHSVENISDLSIHQRHQLLEELYPIHSTEFGMQTFGPPTSFCRMDQLILSTSHMDANTNAQDERHALSLLTHVES